MQHTLPMPTAPRRNLLLNLLSGACIIQSLQNLLDGVHDGTDSNSLCSGYHIEVVVGTKLQNVGTL